MPDPDRLAHLDLDEPQLETLRPWARLFDVFTRQVPATTPYSAEDFVNWLLLERHMQSPEQIAARRRIEQELREALRLARSALRRFPLRATAS